MKIKTLLFIIIIGFFTGSCSFFTGNDDDIIPENIIPKDKMILVLADMQITEAYLKGLRKEGHKVADTSLLYYKMVFKKNDVTSSSFEESLLYYRQDLAVLDQLYADVITRLNELKAKNDELLLIMKNDSIRQDSIAKALFLLDSLRVQDSILHLTDTTYIVSDTILQIK